MTTSSGGGKVKKKKGSSLSFNFRSTEHWGEVEVVKHVDNLNIKKTQKNFCPSHSHFLSVTSTVFVLNYNIPTFYS